MSEQAVTEVDTIADFISGITSDTIFPTTVDLMKQSCSTVLSRIKNNLDATVSEKSEDAIKSFVENVTNNCSRQTNAWVDANAAQLMIVPDGTKLVHRDANRVTVVVEQKPTTRTITFNGSSRGLDPATYRISLPYIQYFINFISDGSNDRFNSMFMTCTTKSLTSLNDTVYKLPLPNVNTNGSVCVGNMATGSSNGSNLVDKINSIITGFWQSNFNFDLSDSMIEFWNSNFPSTNESLYFRRFPDWVAKSNEDSLFGLKATYHPIGIARNLIRNDLASRNGIESLKNEMKTTIRSNIITFVRSLTSDLNSVNLMEENRNQPHVKSLNENLANIARRSYHNMWQKVHARHQQKVNEDNRLLDAKRYEINNIINNSDRIIRNVEQKRNELKEEEVKVKCELYKMYQYLQRQIEEVNELKSKLSSHIDENGNVLEKKKRGRPKKERIPEEVQMSADMVVSSKLVLNPDGTAIVRKRGRPKKNAVVS